MDIEKKRYFHHPSTIKRLTIGATASVMLLLNAKEAVAITCPSLITNAITACNFTANNSVTVGNGGSVSGDDSGSAAIVMAGNNLGASSITINAGGSVNNETSVGISITSSTLTHGLTNNGTIRGTVGIQVQSSSTIGGNISNAGTISGIGNTGIGISNSVISGGITNSGTISSGGTGIRIVASTVNEGISNSGTIQGSSNDSGIAIIGGSVVGDITNNFLIKATGSGDGIVINNSHTGGISNSGTIQSANNAGIGVGNVSIINGNILNRGTISGGGAVSGISIRSSSTVSGSITNSGTINDAAGIGLSVNSSTITGGISNTGAIRGGNTGIAVTGSSSGSAFAISNSGIIEGGNYAILVANASVSDIDILGQTARIIGNVDAVNTNFNVTSGAAFTSDGVFNVQAFHIESNAVFNMEDTITVQNAVDNSGILAVENAETITGDYTQHTGGTLQIGTSSTTNYGRLAVSGNVDLSQSGNINVAVAQNSSLKQGDVLSNVISGNITVPTDGFNVTDNSYLWDFTAATVSGNTGVNLTATINPTAALACQGSYCEGAANVIIAQVTAGNAAFGPYAAVPTESEFQTAASQATPELTNENIQALQLITNSVMDVVPMWNSLHGKSDEDAVRYQPGSVWVKPYGAAMNQDESNTVDGFNAAAYGVVIGRDRQTSANWLMGGAFAVGGDNLNGKSNLDGQSINSTAYQGMLYGVRKFSHHLYLAEEGLVGYENNDTKRSISIYGSTAQGSYNSWFTNLRTELGWNVYERPDFVLTPELDMSYLFVNQSGYQESGSVMDLSVDSNNNSSLVLSAYLHGAYHLTKLNNLKYFTLGAYAGAAYDVLNSQPETTATFVAGGPSFSTFGVQINEVVFRGGLGLSLDNPVKPVTMSLNYDLQAGNNAVSNVGSVTLGYKLS